MDSLRDNIGFIKVNSGKIHSWKFKMFKIIQGTSVVIKPSHVVLDPYGSGSTN